MTDAHLQSSLRRTDFPFKVGDYEVLEEIGRGGMGVIYKARQCCLNRLCAIKMLHGSGSTAPDEGASLKSEAQAAASLDHPNIVGIYEFGVAEGRWYFSMEYVQGVELGHHARKSNLDSTAVAKLARKICDALAYAHAQGVMHHDLKPPNILIDQYGEPQITDFGLARRVDEARRHDPAKGAGSPNFMSPEQASARFGEPGLATDVFGLGAILYYLLTYRPPFRGETPEDTIRAVLTMDPAQPRILRPGVPADLETICLKCLRKQPSQRYSSMKEVSDELGRFLNDEPIRARPAGLVERGRKWCRRHPAIAALGSIIALLLVAFGFGISLAAYHIDQARQRAEASRSEARRDLYAADMLLASQAFSAGNDFRVHDILSRQRPSPGDDDLRGWEWRFLWRATQGDRNSILGKQKAAISQMELTPDGKYLVAADSSGTLNVWDPGTRTELASQAVRPIGAPRFGLAPSANALVTVRVDPAGSNTAVLLLSLPKLEPIRQFSVDRHVVSGAFEPGGQRIWLVGDDLVSSHEALTGRELARWHVAWKGQRRDFAFSHDARLLATGDDAGHISLLDLSNGSTLATLPGHSVRLFWGAAINWLGFSRDDQLLASCGSDGVVRVWTVKSHKLFREVTGHADLVMASAFSPDGARIVSAGKDSFVQLQELGATSAAVQLRGARALQTAACFMPDGRTPISGGLDGEITLWNSVHRSAFQWNTNLPSDTAGVEIMRGNEYFGALNNDFGGTVYRISDGAVICRVLGASDRIGMLVEHLDGGKFLCAMMDRAGEIRIREEPSGTEHLIHTTFAKNARTSGMLSAELTPDGKGLAIADLVDGTTVYDLATFAVRCRFDVKARALAISNDSRWLAAGDVTGHVRLLDLASGKESPCAMDHPQLSNLQFSPDGSQLATVGFDGTITLWDVTDGRKLMRLSTTAGNLFSIAWLPDGSRIFGGTLSGAVAVWDVATRRETLVCRAHTQLVTSLSVMADGTLISAGPDGVCQWHVADKSEPGN